MCAADNPIPSWPVSPRPSLCPECSLPGGHSSHPDLSRTTCCPAIKHVKTQTYLSSTVPAHHLPQNPARLFHYPGQRQIEETIKLVRPQAPEPAWPAQVWAWLTEGLGGIPLPVLGPACACLLLLQGLRLPERTLKTLQEFAPMHPSPTVQVHPCLGFSPSHGKPLGRRTGVVLFGPPFSAGCRERF